MEICRTVEEVEAEIRLLRGLAAALGDQEPSLVARADALAAELNDATRKRP